MATALCFTRAAETYHHWKVFSPGNAGTCIEFEEKALGDALKTGGVKLGAVTYLRISELKSQSRDIRIEQWPFLKRVTYSDEQEVRALYCSKNEAGPTKSIPIPLNCISRIITSPWMPNALQEAVKQTLIGLDGCESLHITASKLIHGHSWDLALRQGLTRAARS